MILQKSLYTAVQKHFLFLLSTLKTVVLLNIFVETDTFLAGFFDHEEYKG